MADMKTLILLSIVAFLGTLLFGGWVLLTLAAWHGWTTTICVVITYLLFEGAIIALMYHLSLLPDDEDEEVATN